MLTPKFCYLIFLLLQTKWLPQNFDRMHLGKRGWEESLLMTLEKVNGNFNFQSNDPPLMLIRPSLTFRLISLPPGGITYKHFPGSRGLC